MVARAEEGTSELELCVLTDGIGWVRLPGISGEGSKLQLETDISPSKQFWCVPHFPHRMWQESIVSRLGLRAGAADSSSQTRVTGFCRDRRAFPDLLEL